ncbi:MAG TPA: pentapeptide repeat-containing protein [Acetobacteraceae bacterium]|nr:pentapeptide repeat-containing protein [Acetobacteraceae bacterium]
MLEDEFPGTDLRGANLAGASLSGAYLGSALLVQTHLEGASLEDVVGLTIEQLALAYGDAKTRLPAGIARPPHWPAAEEEPGSRDQPPTKQDGPSR